MNKNFGWISLHRKIQDHWIWDNPLYLKMWLYILFRANYENKNILFNDRLIPVKRGEFITSLKNMANDCKCGMQQIRTFLKISQSDSMLITKSTNKATHISIINYDVYQDSQQTNNKQITNKQQTNNKQITTDNNVNNVNNNPDVDAPVEKTENDTLPLFALWNKPNPTLGEIQSVENLLKEFTIDQIKAAFRKSAEQNILKVSYVRGILTNKGDKPNGSTQTKNPASIESRLSYRPDPSKYEQRLAELTELFDR